VVGGGAEVLTAKDFDLLRTDTCFVLGVVPSATALIKPEPLALECGGQLSPGDGITRLGKKGYSANPQIHMADGWSQWYIGLIDLVDLDGRGRDGQVMRAAVFKAWHSSGESAFKSREESAKWAHREWFIAYAWSEETTSLCFWSAAMAFRWIKTNAITRA
jgi:hypothetical protein